jgi:hypothetical protein
VARRGVCIFCGTYGPLSREDPIPRWMADVLRQFSTGPEILLTRSQVDKGDVIWTHTRKVGAASAYKVRRVCQKSCNGGWMADLEREAKPILTPLVRGERRGLLAADQEVIARWMVLKALFFDLVEAADDTAAEVDFKSYFASRTPPERFEVWLARYEPEALHVLQHYRSSFRTRIPLEGIPANTPHSQFLTLVFGHLILQSIFVNQQTVTYPPTYSRPEPEPHIVRVWPTSATVDWPPPLKITPDLIRVFSSGINSDGTLA